MKQIHWVFKLSTEHDNVYLAQPLSLCFVIEQQCSHLPHGSCSIHKIAMQNYPIVYTAQQFCYQ